MSMFHAPRTSERSRTHIGVRGNAGKNTGGYFDPAKVTVARQPRAAKEVARPLNRRERRAEARGEL